ncbi:hypothetical protein OEIGOIKO_02538 [Streptomyces chrestomyceticus JCM 4735]|uniref:Uncharacterized protein n=1 Tax=Streptomyces chrestomyceticus JCM 4735 TaxID=1306181 RepID=A0A7U9KSU8_9ACTN|nr:hypothetical protein [Streptomyces chrestomyceticus]GCD34799.1 hypothetical protein OEIGOIKO_02538 [Streptomyces chrestomyceticus JCM 4735]
MDRTALDALAARMKESGTPDREQVFRELREQGMSPIETIYVAARVFDMSLPEAKSAIYESPAWRDQGADWRRLQDEAAESAGDSSH